MHDPYTMIYLSEFSHDPSCTIRRMIVYKYYFPSNAVTCIRYGIN